MAVPCSSVWIQGVPITGESSGGRPSPVRVDSGRWAFSGPPLSSSSPPRRSAPYCYIVPPLKQKSIWLFICEWLTHRFSLLLNLRSVLQSLLPSALTLLFFFLSLLPLALNLQRHLFLG